MTKELRYGPNTAAVERMLDQMRSATPQEMRRLAEARAHAGEPEWETARDAAWEAFWDVNGAKRADWWSVAGEVPWDASWPPAWLAIFAVIVRDLITPEHFDALTHLWVEVFGPTWEER